MKAPQVAGNITQPACVYKYLNLLVICRIPLSMKTVQGVLTSCINIRELRISDWSVSSEEFSQLAASIKENNWDLTVSRKSRV